jgi:hypothetical protein
MKEFKGRDSRHICDIFLNKADMLLQMGIKHEI